MRRLLAVLLALPLAPAAVRAQNAEHGKEVYLLKCSQCHGLEGTPFVKNETDPADTKKDADGHSIVDDKNAPAAAFLMPRPRDFTRGLFKVRSTPSGEIPTDEDLVRVVSNGMPGSSMPAWKGALSDSDIRDVVAYVKSFSSRFASEKPSKVLDLSGAVSASKDSLAKGKALFTENGCNACHGEQGRGDGPSAPTLVDEWGTPIRPANFHKPWTLRGGSSREDIFRTFMMGLNGTPMPAYLDVFGDTKEGREKGWHLANYIASLGEGRPDYQQVLRAEYRDKLPDTMDDPAWDKRPTADFPLVGQVVAEPRLFTPSIDRVSAKAFYTKDELGLLLEWDDRIKDDTDAFEVEVPRRFAPEPGSGTEKEKPYFLRGDPQKPVELWRWDAKKDKLTAWTSKGPKSKPEAIKSDGVYVSSAAFADGLWRLYIRRKLEPGDEAGVGFQPRWFVPIAFFAWDGSNGDQGLKSSISTWYFLLLEPQTPSTAYAMPVLALFAALAVEGWLLKRRSYSSSKKKSRT